MHKPNESDTLPPRARRDVGLRDTSFPTAQSVRGLLGRHLLSLIGQHGVINAEQLSRLSGYSPSSISTETIDLVEKRRIFSDPLERKGVRGQPPKQFRLNPDAGYAISCAVDRAGYRLCCVNLCGDVVELHRDVDPEPLKDPTGAGLIEAIFGFAKTVPIPATRLQGIALVFDATSTAGETGAVGSHGHAIGSVLESMLGLPVRLYEAGAAAGWSARDVVDPLRNDAFLSLFIGHHIHGQLNVPGGLPVPLTPGRCADRSQPGPVVCLDETASVAALQRRVRLLGGDEQALASEDWSPMAAPWMQQAWLREAGLAVAAAIGEITMLTGARLCVLDGALPPDMLRDYVAVVRGQLQSEHGGAITVLQGRDGPDSSCIGAARLVLSDLIFSRW